MAVLAPHQPTSESRHSPAEPEASVPAASSYPLGVGPAHEHITYVVPNVFAIFACWTFSGLE
jgi:hypothetical protein